MDEATKQALNAFVQKMIASAEQAGSFAVEQTPLLVQEWLRWQLWESVLIAVAAFVVAVVLAVITRRLLYRDDWDDFMPFQILAGIGAVIASGVAFQHAALALKVFVAPRVVILEKFMDLVR
jgi:hypothetical protein